MRVDSGQASFIAAAMLRRFEGLRLTTYFCEAGKLTVGYGHVIKPGDDWMRAGITALDAESILLKDLSWAMYEARRVERVLTDGQAAALASLVFNIGPEAWRTSTIKQMVEAGDMSAASGQFGRWVKAGGRVSKGLVMRRAAERKIFEGESWVY